MTPLQRFTQALEQRGHRIRKSGHDYVTTCPAHDDKTPSLSFREGDKGVVATCHTGCTFDAIVTALNIDPTDLFHDAPVSAHEPRTDHASRITATYDYLDETGALLFQAVRLRDPKTFRQRRPDGDGWTWNLGDVRRVPYRLPELLNAGKEHKAVWVCEGEKDADNLAALGFVTTTAPMGAGKWHDEYAAYFAGIPWALVVTDSDNADPNRKPTPKPPAGREHAATVCASLHAAGVRCRLIDLAPDREDGYDVSDFILEHNGNSRERLEAAARQAPAWPVKKRPSLPIVSWAEFSASVGEYDPSRDYLGALVRGGQRVHVIGPIGHGKTTFMAEILSAAAYGNDFLGFTGPGSLRVLYIELGDMEDGEVKETFDAARFNTNDAHFDLVHLPDGLKVDRNEQHRQMIEDAMDKYHVVAIDPWYKLIDEELSDGMKNVRTVTAFLDGLRDRFPNAALVIGFHANEPQKGQRIRGLGDASGYKAFQRGANTAVLFERVSGNRSRLTWAKTRSKFLPKMGETWLLGWERGQGFKRIERQRATDELFELLTDEWRDAYDLSEEWGKSRNRTSAVATDLCREGRAQSQKVGARVEFRRAPVGQEVLDVAA